MSKQLPFDQLRTLHREIGPLIAQRRHEELTALREKTAILGFTAEDLMPKKNGKVQARKYRDPASGQTWSGRGHRPQWIKDALDEGRQLKDYLVAS